MLTVVQDCQCLQKLTSLGLLRAAWRPSAEVRVLRAVSRQRETLLTAQASWVQRTQMAPVQMNRRRRRNVGQGRRKSDARRCHAAAR